MGIRSKAIGATTATLIATAGLTGADLATPAQPAEAASCAYSNLTTTKIKNASCKAGAYAYKSGKTWHQSGAWASNGTFSYNWTAVCYVTPGMIGVI